MDWRGLADNLAVVAAFVGSIGFLGYATWKTVQFIRRVIEVLDLLLGDPHATPPRLSVMEHVLQIQAEQVDDRVEFREHLAYLHRQAAGENVRQMRRGSGPKREAEHG